MGKITDIKPQTRNAGRVSIFIDGEFACGLDKLTVLTHRLHIGDEIDEDSLRAAVAGSESTAAFEKAVKYLGAKPRTAKEIKMYLSGKGYSPEAVNSAVSKLEEYKYVDDAEYCRAYIAEYRRKFGVRRLQAELYAKGVSREIADEALENMESQSDEIVRIAEKYLHGHPRDKRKLISYLTGRGFEYDEVRSVVNEMDFECGDVREVADDDDFCQNEEEYDT